MSIRIQSEAKGFPITIKAVLLGDDVNISIFGGEKGHIGAVALAQPRSSLANPAMTSASTSVITLCGHKEDRLACEMAEKAAIAVKGVVSVACGIHVDGASAEQINSIVCKVNEMVEDLLHQLGASKQPMSEK
ncbi:prenylated flavin chaperone LpdD [Desulfocastanea catecholica]